MVPFEGVSSVCTSLAVVILSAVLALSPSLVHSTNAVFSQTATSDVNQFAGATFTPTVAPVISPTAIANTISLQWKPVSISSGAAVTYTVTRRSGVSGPTLVCTGVDTPVMQGQNMTCTDANVTVGTSYTYTEEPAVVLGGQKTWSLPASAESVAVCLKKCK